MYCNRFKSTLLISDYLVRLVITVVIVTIGQLSYLYYLDLTYSQLSGPIPSTIGQLSYLYYLDLYGNQLTGVVPATLCQLQYI